MDLAEISSQTFAGRLLRLPLKAIPERSVMRIMRGRLRGKRWIAGAGNHGCWLGTYEQHKQKLFEGEVSSGQVVFDVGANSGFYTLLASELVGPSGQVVAFEPLPSNLKYMGQHLVLNGVANVRVVDSAVTDVDGVARFEVEQSRYMGRIAENGTLEVSTVTLDHYCAGASVRPPNLIKIDIEGAEMKALKGAVQLLQSVRPAIFLATHSAEIHSECCTFLSGLNYLIKPIDCDDLDNARELFCVYTQ